jgi:hypothetical protein
VLQLDQTIGNIRPFGRAATEKKFGREFGAFAWHEVLHSMPLTKSKTSEWKGDSMICIWREKNRWHRHGMMANKTVEC